MGSAAEWLREERRKTLGDWVSFCLRCGHAQRYFGDPDGEVRSACPTCGGPMLSRCGGCGSRVSSMFAIECEHCGAALREPEQFGARIRKPGG